MKASSRALHGGSRLVFDTVEGITNSVEHMHATIAQRALPWASRPTEFNKAHGYIASAVYATIRGTNSALRTGLDSAFSLLPKASSSEGEQSDAEIRAIAAINGAFGDHLEATNNSLAQAMILMTSNQDLEINRAALTQDIPQASTHVVILVHGLCMSERGWRREDNTDIGSRLGDEQDCTPLYLRYNSGRHISTNGKEFTQLLEQLVDAWPVPIESLSLIGHSMGGLLIRSACWYADKDQSEWLQKLTRITCLGTPHHGSPVAKAGHALNLAMEAMPYVKPLAFGRKRSAGIKDLRHGDLLDEDWQTGDDDSTNQDKRTPVPLLPGIDYYFIAATLGQDEHDPLGHALGDMLVRMGSAMGAHDEDLHTLKVKPENCRLFHEKSHLALLTDEHVQQQIVDWFEPKARFES
ncbi:MAG: pimeloyl-ACP methyl ester carboxylesterase [Halioglobus sp.]|jgi:pimeloyl-ACP methyl ester carboxylesterase